MICLIVMAAGCGPGFVTVLAADSAAGSAKSFSVLSFGAKGNGVADDAPAIQRTLTAAAVAGGGLVTIPCGEFALNSVAGAAPSGRSILYLKGSSGVQIAGQGSCSHLFTKLQQKSVIEFDRSTQVTVTNVRISAPNVAYVETYGMDGGSAVRFTGVDHGNINQVEVDGASAGALYLTAGSSNNAVTSNFVHDTDGAGIWEDDCGATSAQNCAPSLPPSNNVYDSNTLTNTALVAMLSALSTDDGGGSSHAIIRNNVISWTHALPAGKDQVHCIQIGNTTDVSVLNNSCTSAPYDGIVITTSNTGKAARITFQGNTIASSGSTDIGGSGIVVYDDPTGGGISDVTITSNNITLAKTDGIRIYSASRPGGILDVQVLKNAISMVDQLAPGSRYGVDVEYSALVTVSGNTITCDGSCIAGGVNVNRSVATTPTATSNQVNDIKGQPLIIQ